MTRDRSIAYDAVQACTLLREAGGAAGKDPRPLINVCDRHNLFGELATALLARCFAAALVLLPPAACRAQPEGESCLQAAAEAPDAVRAERQPSRVGPGLRRAA